MNTFLQVTQMGLGNWAIHIIVIAALSMLAANYLKGIYVKDFTAAVLLAIVLSLLNATVGWVLRGVASPLNWITLGLFSGLIGLVINSIVVYIADRFLKGFEAKNIFWTVAFALVLGVGTFLLNIIT